MLMFAPTLEARRIAEEKANFLKIMLYEIHHNRKEGCFLRIFTSGSFARGTSVGPEVGDIDIVVVFKHWNHEEFVGNRRQLRDWLVAIGSSGGVWESQDGTSYHFIKYKDRNLTIRLQKTSLGVLFGYSSDDNVWKKNTTFDLLPAKVVDSQLQIGKIYQEENPYTDPEAAYNLTRECNGFPFLPLSSIHSFSEDVMWTGRFLEYVRALKTWNVNNGKPFNSFHLEVLCCEAYKESASFRKSTDNCESPLRCFGHLCVWLRSNPSPLLKVGVPGFGLKAKFLQLESHRHRHVLNEFTDKYLQDHS